ncbi:Uncharacterized protein dnm_065750 [Desulfonema magnum]|uniref:Uncharacterized protein n=1 Tax=Desulfonema magnum TaxID=45655 RepID=A0A975BRI4_9BACT|nr:Uncharacterized protein dnm_065750 [Desulfonema magnum]
MLNITARVAEIISTRTYIPTNKNICPDAQGKIIPYNITIFLYRI